MTCATKTALAGVLALAGLAATADPAPAQFYYYNYGANPYGGVYNNYSYTNPGALGVTPYGIYNTPYTAYQSHYYANPFYGTGVYNSYYQAPSLYGPGGYQYRYWRFR